MNMMNVNRNNSSEKKSINKYTVIRQVVMNSDETQLKDLYIQGHKNYITTMSPSSYIKNGSF